MQRIYKKKEYVLYKASGGFIVQNILMKGFAHTHVNSKDAGLRLIGLSICKKIPHNLSTYMLISLLRINDDYTYLARVESLLKSKNNRNVTHYYNSKNRVRR